MKLFRFNNKRKNTKIAAILAASLILSSLSGCGKKAAEPIPELMNPLAAAEAYRPVEIGSVGDIYILNGIVVPKEYPVFSEKMFQIADINVRMGNYVNEGDVIATGNTLAVDRQITSLN